MPAAERTITIDRPVSAVFDYVADGANAPRWRSGVLDVELASGAGLGAIYRQGVRGPGGRRIAADYEVTAFEPGDLIAFQAIAGPVRPDGSFRFASAGEGTRLTFALHAEVGGLKGLLMGRAVQSTMDGEMAALDRLREILEG
jgi:uncharacterized membrane protein